MSREIVFIPDGHILWDPGSGILSRIFPNAALNPQNMWVPLYTNQDGALIVTSESDRTSSTAVLTAVLASVTTVQLLAANNARKGAIFYNNSNSPLWLAFAPTASSTLFTEYLEPGSTYELEPPVYLGVFSAIWQSAGGAMQITELT